MYLNDLDGIPNRINSGMLTKEKAKVEILTVLYTNPRRFNLGAMDEDERSDFLLSIFNNFDKLILSYNPEYSPFGAFIYNYVACYKLSWNKNKFKSLLTHQALQSDLDFDYNFESEKRLENTFKIAEKTQFYNTEPLNLVFHRIFKNPVGRSVKNIKQIKERAVLILALKSAWYISDEQINKVSQMCRCSPELFSELIKKLKVNLECKATKHEELQKKRDTAYCFLRSYKKQLEVVGNEYETAETIKKKIEYQFRNWVKKNEILRNSAQRIVPSNQEIGKILDIDQKKVSMCITTAKRKGVFSDLETVEEM